LSDIAPRIEAMHRRDRRVAVAFVVGLWFAILFVAWATWHLAPSGGLRLLLLAGGVVILVFNTAAILAMLRHYREDRDFIYGLDIRFIRFLDEARARR
jgi:multisubunit Na+/H+ antiporter MnhB subunit